MNIQDQKELVSGLRRVQEVLCAYRGIPCDCKYGADHVAEPREDGNGCPEVRAAVALVASMTPAEFKRIVNRSHKKPVKGVDFPRGPSEYGKRKREEYLQDQKRRIALRPPFPSERTS